MGHTPWWPLAVVVVSLLADMGLAAAPAASPEEMLAVLKTLRRGHPRLFVTAEGLEALRKQVEAGGPLAQAYERMRAEADKVLDAPTVEHRLEGPRLLTQSRRCLDRVSKLALAYRLSGEKKYADRAAREMAAAAAFPDWNPSHFLDTAEMSCALGIGYDWLYDVLPADERERVRRAIVEKGLGPGLECYRGKAAYRWWTRATHNWSQVCNGGLAVGALAVADEEPAAAAEVLVSGLKAVRGAMGHFDIDGGWDEGPGYWGYTLMYTSFYLGALQSALGTMADLEKSPGLSEAGMFRIYFSGPLGRTFNFADAGDGAGRAPSMFWLARTFDRPVYAYHQLQAMRGDAFDLLWAPDRAVSPKEAGLPLAKHFRGVGVVFFRSDWESRDALWVGFKGGDNRANHSHLDLGSFVLDALGQRWALDLGPDDYNLPGYFGGQRWTYYRLNTQSHNTLLLDGQDQDPKAKAPIVAFVGREDGGHAIADLSAAYPKAKSVLRGLAMLGPADVLVQDEVVAAEPVEVVWGMLTQAEVKVDGARATLEQGGKRLHLSVLAPEGAVVEVTGASPPPPQKQQPDVHRIVVRLPGKVGAAQVAVRLSTADPAQAAAVTVRPLRQWEGWLRREGPAARAGGGSK